MLCRGTALAMLNLIACATAGPETNTFCSAARPIYKSRADKLTDQTT